jgi:peptidoglycan-associated lipoprotein
MRFPVRNRTKHGMLANRLLAAAVVAAMVAGCAPTSYVVLLKSPDGSTGEVVVKGKKGEQVIKTANEEVPLDGSAPPAPVEKDKFRNDFGEAMAARPRIPVRYLLYFKDGTTLTDASAALIPKIIVEAATRPAVDLSVIGHTDTLASAEYNDRLALERAKAVAALLKEKGLKVIALTVESHGKRNLLVPTPDNTYEPRNRRVEVSIR